MKVFTDTFGEIALKPDGELAIYITSTILALLYNRI